MSSVKKSTSVWFGRFKRVLAAMQAAKDDFERLLIVYETLNGVYAFGSRDNAHAARRALEEVYDEHLMATTDLPLLLGSLKSEWGKVQLEKRLKGVKHEKVTVKSGTPAG